MEHRIIFTLRNHFEAIGTKVLLQLRYFTINLVAH